MRRAPGVWGLSVRLCKVKASCVPCCCSPPEGRVLRWAGGALCWPLSLTVLCLPQPGEALRRTSQLVRPWDLCRSLSYYRLLRSSLRGILTGRLVYFPNSCALCFFLLCGPLLTGVPCLTGSWCFGGREGGRCGLSVWTECCFYVFTCCLWQLSTQLQLLNSTDRMLTDAQNKYKSGMCVVAFENLYRRSMFYLK